MSSDGSGRVSDEVTLGRDPNDRRVVVLGKGVKAWGRESRPGECGFFI